MMYLGKNWDEVTRELIRRAVAAELIPDVTAEPALATVEPTLTTPALMMSIQPLGASAAGAERGSDADAAS
jgi:hypothetical protein